MEYKPTIIFYIDVNNAFLSWTATEMLKEGYPIDIRNIPSIIGGDEEKRHGVVLAKSPVAKKYGVKTGEPIFQARNKCPNLEIYPLRRNIYQKYSNLLYEFYKKYTDKVARFSIDECCLDMTKYIMKNENPIIIAKEMSNKIKENFGFTVNIGISHNRLLAKMASDLEKPDKIHTLYSNEIKSKMWTLPVSELFMVGRKSLPKLYQLGIKTIGDLANYDKQRLIKRFGKYGRMIHEYANGIDNEEITYEEEKPKGVGNSVTLAKDCNNKEELERVLLKLTEESAGRLRKHNMLTKTINVQIKTKDFQVYSHQGKITSPTSSTKIIFEKVKQLLNEMYKGEYVRLLGVRLDGLIENDEVQISLFDTEKNEKLEKLDNVLDNLKEKYGNDKIKRAGDL